MKVKRFVIVLIISLFSTLAVAQTYENNPSPTLRDTIVFDYSALTWLDAFDSLHACMSLRYPYTEWKAVDWQAKEIITRPLINEAQNTNDTIAFIQALFEYLYKIPDGHINLVGNVDGFKQEKLAGTYGFNMLPIADVSVIASSVPEEGPAYAAGIHCGDRILKWNGVNIDSVSERELWNYFRNYGTLEGRLFSRYLMLSRDAVGAQAEVTFENYETKVENTVTLESIDDEYELFVIGIFNTASPSFMDPLVAYEIRESGVGYLRISAEDSDGMTPEEVMESEIFIETVNAINYFNENDVSGLIVDLRFNLGGNDLLAAVMMGLFYESSTFYEYITGTYDDAYAIMYSLWTEPITPQFTGEIAVIVDPNCISTGEGIAMLFQRLNNAHIVSFSGTNASFGIVDYGPVYMPSELVITFPQAMSLDENYIIQLDSDSTMSGGVSPDIRVPLTVENVIAQWEEGRDVQLEFAESLLLDIDEILMDQVCLLYPNPCSDYINLRILAETQNSYNVSLYNLQGQLVYFKQLNYINESHVFKLDLSGLNSGIYFYSISDGFKEYKSKIIVNH